MKTAHRKEFGDFQTPLPLALEVCRIIHGRLGEFDSVIEPTCGIGAFVRAAGEVFPRAGLVGYEINESHLNQARAAVVEDHLESRVSLIRQDFFTANWTEILSAQSGRILVLGNPPWVTNAGVSALGGANVPAKDNFQGHRGIAARTGKANFDISEWMLIRLLEAAKGRTVTIAVLCKTATARKVLRHAWQKQAHLTKASVHQIDAAVHFGVSVDACLFVAELGEDGPHEAELFESLAAEHRHKRFGLAGQDLVADLDAYERLRHLEGQSPYRWRSGIKHDCAPVMELTKVGDDLFQNQMGETVSLESAVVYPLLKSTPLFHGRLTPERWVLVTQRRVGESTERLANEAPDAWRYLQSHADKFAARKSSIYQRGDAFALFGVGDYTFSSWKVAVSGLHRPPRFQVIAPLDGLPVMFDDTCYFTSVDSREEAELVAGVLNSEICAAFMQALTLPEAKRPVTSDLLHRLNFRELARESGWLEKWEECRSGKSSASQAMLANSQLEFLMEEPVVYGAAK